MADEPNPRFLTVIPASVTVSTASIPNALPTASGEQRLSAFPEREKTARTLNVEGSPLLLYVDDFLGSKRPPAPARRSESQLESGAGLSRRLTNCLADDGEPMVGASWIGGQRLKRRRMGSTEPASVEDDAVLLGRGTDG